MRVVRWIPLAAGLFLLAIALLFAPLFDWMAPRRIDRRQGAAARPGPSPRPVLLVSIDGLAPWVLANARAPTLARLAAEGVSAAHARTIVPSYTLASHASMLSGVGPAEHGVFWNRYQPWSRIAVPTVFTVCARDRLRCGLFAGKRKFAHFAEAEPGVELYAHADDAETVLALAADYLRERSPDLVVVHLAEVDLSGHADGWGSDAQRRVIERTDALLGAFLERVRPSRPLAVIVTSDHGGHGDDHGSDRPEDVEIPWIAWGDGVRADGDLSLVATVDTAPTLVRLLGRRAPVGWAGRARLAFARPGSP